MPAVVDINRSDSHTEAAVAIDRFPRVIGRAWDCDYLLLRPQVSRHHCRLFVEEGDIRLTDLGSRNGTFVNGRRVTAPVVLDDGDRIEIGSYCFRCGVGVGDEGEPVLSLRPTDYWPNFRA